VLTYHSIADAGNGPDTVTPRLLASHLRFLAERGWQPLDPVTFGDGLSVPPDAGRSRGFLITLDDGYADTLSAALPVLQRFDSRGIVFVATDYVGRTDEFNGPGRTRKPMLTWDEIRVLRAAGLHIGSHSCSHRSLARLSTKEVEREIVESKARLEAAISAPVSYFAYPYGETTPTVERLVEAAGYHAGFAGPGPMQTPYRIPRVAVGGADSILRLRLKLGRAYRVARLANRILTR
jgi:peptidoglycan/xylan/chitin deacetylase (PgdA/CDA1 family)